MRVQIYGSCDLRLPSARLCIFIENGCSTANNVNRDFIGLVDRKVQWNYSNLQQNITRFKNTASTYQVTKTGQITSQNRFLSSINSPYPHKEQCINCVYANICQIVSEGMNYTTRMRWTGHVACKRNNYFGLPPKPAQNSL